MGYNPDVAALFRTMDAPPTDRPLRPRGDPVTSLGSLDAAGVMVRLAQRRERDAIDRTTVGVFLVTLADAFEVVAGQPIPVGWWHHAEGRGWVRIPVLDRVLDDMQPVFTAFEEWLAPDNVATRASDAVRTIEQSLAAATGLTVIPASTIDAVVALGRGMLPQVLANLDRPTPSADAIGG